MNLQHVSFNIVGGTAVRFLKPNLRMVRIPGIMLLVILALSVSAFAQGSITGTVTNSDLSTPADGVISFVGFLDDTDEEIRLETSVGAGYQSGNWFDDFQNYQTEAPGDQYDFLFYNSANGEGFHLSGLVPNNSFEVQNVSLAPVAWPAAPTGLSGVSVSTSTLILTWDDVPGVTWHVYRRAATSNGSFFRRDDPTGSLANPGVATNYFVDNTVDGVSSYTYLLIAEDGSGNLSRHSAPLTISSAAPAAPVLTDIMPTGGTAAGGTNVTLTGSGFDPAGATILFGATPVTATVVSPFELTAQSPAGSVGASVDITVTNTASGLASNTLVGGFTYNPNATPVLTAIGAQSTTEGVLLSFGVSATDVDGDTPILTTSALPGTASFVDGLDGTGTFSWTPAFTEAGTYNVTFYATDANDALLVDSEVVAITVIEAGNQTPVLAPVNDTTVAEGGSLVVAVSATDADGEIPGLSASGPDNAPLPANASFLDNANGTGALTFNPDFGQAGVYDIVFKAVDAALDVDSVVMQITVTEINQLPVLAAIGAQNGTENVLLQFVVTATDADGTIPILSTSTPLPGTAIFVDSANGTGVFEWTPTFTDAGTYNVTFFATDADVPTDIDSEQVVITIVDAGNQPPVLTAIATPQQVAEGGALNIPITASDPDGTLPVLTALNLPAANATFVDNGDGTASFDFNPDFTQSGIYTVTFIADDGALADSQDVEIQVIEGGNVPPVITPPGDFAVNEGQSLQFIITADDPDDVTPPALSVSTSLGNYTFTDNGDGTGTFTYNPNFLSAGIDTVIFFATDFGTPQQSSSVSSQITTNDVNQPPVWTPAGPFSVAADDSLIFTVIASDSTDPNPAHRLFLSVVGTPPANSQFTDNGDGTGTFRFAPTLAQVGAINVTFLAADQGVPQGSTTLPVSITVVAVNNPPVFDPVDAAIVNEGEQVTINVAVTDADGGIPALSVANPPEGSSFTDNGDGTGVFTWTPGFLGGTRLVAVDFRATDGISVTKKIVLVQVNDAGNQAPVFDPLPTIDPVTEGEQIVVTIGASDPDGGSIILELDTTSVPANVSFVDNGDGTGTITFDPDFTQAGDQQVTIIAYDGDPQDANTASTSIVVTITVLEAGNQPPILASIGNRTVNEGATLNIAVSATDADGPSLTLTTSTLPANAAFTDNTDGTGSFTFTPDLTQAGAYPITFFASDGIATDSEVVTITVNDVNQLPFVFTSGGRTIFEADTLNYQVTTFDADGTLPFIEAYLSTTDTLATNMTFVDNRDGTGTLTFMPDYSQGGPQSNPTTYNVVFRVTDEDYPGVQQTSETVTIQVINRNEPPTLTFPDGAGPFQLNEGESLTFTVLVLDGDAVLPPSLTAQNMPDSNATFNVSANSGTFNFTPDFTQAGSYLVRFIAVDQAAAADTADVAIEVFDAGNQPPTFSEDGGMIVDTMHIPVGHELQIAVHPYDPDLDSVSIEAFPILPGAEWIDYGDGSGLYRFTPDSSYLGSLIEITFVATDYPSLSTDTLVTRALVLEFLRGDVDGSGYYNINDVQFLISYLYRDGDAPLIIETADVDGDSRVTIADITYLIYFIWYFGPQPPQ